MQHHSILFGTTPPVVLDPSKEVSMDPNKLEARKQAQEKLVANMKESGKIGVLLVARFVARMVAEETKKLTTGAQSTTEEFSLFDHLERLRFLEMDEVAVAADKTALAEVLKMSAEGLEDFLNNGRYDTVLGKMAYNAIGVTFSGGRDDKPESKLLIDERECTRTPYGTSRQTGAGLYLVSSYMSHSCAPSVRPSFPGTNELHLIACQNISKGDELTMAYVDVKGPPDSDPLTTRRARRHALARGWRFACTCTRCLADAPTGTTGEGSPMDDFVISGAGAQVEAPVSRFEQGMSGPELRSKHADDVE